MNLRCRRLGEDNAKLRLVWKSFTEASVLSAGVFIRSFFTGTDMVFLTCKIRHRKEWTISSSAEMCLPVYD